MRFGYGYHITQTQANPRLSGAGIPSDASGTLGQKYLDTATGIEYEKRWVANREGAGDSILFPINLFPSVGDFDFSVRVRTDIVPNGSLDLVGSYPAARTANALWVLPAGGTTITARLTNSAGTMQYETTAVSQSLTTWKTIGMKRVSTSTIVTVNGTQVAQVASPSWTPSLTEIGVRALSGGDAGGSTKCCDLRLTGPGGSIIAPLNEGSGTVITNQAGANGTLTDGTPTNFWYQAWVPVI